MKPISPKRILWIALGCISVGIGTIGMFVPLLPTTGFMIFAAFAFARSSPRLHKWLLTHKVFGPLITNWNEHRAISNKAKISSVISMVAIVALSVIFHVSWMVIGIQVLVLSCVAAFLLTRPVPPSA